MLGVGFGEEMDTYCVIVSPWFSHYDTLPKFVQVGQARGERSRNDLNPFEALHGRYRTPCRKPSNATFETPNAAPVGRDSDTARDVGANLNFAAA